MREYYSPLYSVNYHCRKCIFFPRFHSSPILQFYFDLTLKGNQNKSFAYNFKYTSSTRSRSENIFSMYSKFTHCDQSILITSQHCTSVSGDFFPSIFLSSDCWSLWHWHWRRRPAAADSLLLGHTAFSPGRSPTGTRSKDETWHRPRPNPISNTMS